MALSANIGYEHVVFVGKEGRIWYGILDAAADSHLGGVTTFAAMLLTPPHTTRLKLFMTLVYILFVRRVI